ncbi:MAG: sulfotransferase [Planctomycetales bacterium]|nr:sulfotransferase [Planctomycetales bacterium]
MNKTTYSSNEPMQDSIADLVEPCFLVGAERSGTTLFRLMLDHHPDLAFHSEFEFAVDLLEDGRFPDMDAYHAFLETDRVFQLTGHDVDQSLAYPELVHSFLEQKRLKDGKTMVGATVHRHFDRLLSIWPHARFIHILRDPRDVARSNLKMGWSGNVYFGVDRWIEAEETWERLKSTLDSDRYMEVRYLDLVTNTEGVLREACQFLGVEFSEQMFEYADSSTYDLPDARALRQWEKKLSANEVRWIEAKAQDMMQRRGFSVTTESPQKVGVLESLYLRIHDFVILKRARVQRFGFLNLAGHFVTRRLGLVGLEKRIKLRMNEVQNQQIK